VESLPSDPLDTTSPSVVESVVDRHHALGVVQRHGQLQPVGFVGY
jgi:hypothetical protein